MNCPICNAESKVVDSRPKEDSVYRRRECLECKNRFSTIEIDADYYATLKPRNKKAFQEALLDGYAQLTKKLYQALNFNERNIEDENESCG